MVAPMDFFASCLQPKDKIAYHCWYLKAVSFHSKLKIQ